MLACERPHVRSCVKLKLAHQRCSSLTCLCTMVGKHTPPWWHFLTVKEQQASHSLASHTPAADKDCWCVRATRQKTGEVMRLRCDHNLVSLLLLAVPRGQPAIEDHHVGHLLTWLPSYIAWNFTSNTTNFTDFAIVKQSTVHANFRQFCKTTTGMSLY